MIRYDPTDPLFRLFERAVKQRDKTPAVHASHTGGQTAFVRMQRLPFFALFTNFIQQFLLNIKLPPTQAAQVSNNRDVILK